MGTKKITKELTEYIKRVKERIDPEKIILYGSFARGEAKDGSDIDLIVISKFKKIPLKRRFEILYDLHEGLRDNFDFHVYDVTPKQYEKSKPNTIFDDIKRDGKILYQKSKSE